MLTRKAKTFLTFALVSFFAITPSAQGQEVPPPQPPQDTLICVQLPNASDNRCLLKSVWLSSELDNLEPVCRQAVEAATGLYAEVNCIPAGNGGDSDPPPPIQPPVNPSTCPAGLVPRPGGEGCWTGVETCPEGMTPLLAGGCSSATSIPPVEPPKPGEWGTPTPKFFCVTFYANNYGPQGHHGFIDGRRKDCRPINVWQSSSVIGDKNPECRSIIKMLQETRDKANCYSPRPKGIDYTSSDVYFNNVRIRKVALGTKGKTTNLRLKVACLSQDVCRTKVTADAQGKRTQIRLNIKGGKPQWVTVNLGRVRKAYESHINQVCSQYDNEVYSTDIWNQQAAEGKRPTKAALVKKACRKMLRNTIAVRFDVEQSNNSLKKRGYPRIAQWSYRLPAVPKY